MAYSGNPYSADSDPYCSSANNDGNSRPSSYHNTHQHHSHEQQQHQNYSGYYDNYDTYAEMYLPHKYLEPEAYPPYNRSYSRQPSHHKEYYSDSANAYPAGYYDYQQANNTSQQLPPSTRLYLQKPVKMTTPPVASKPIVKKYTFDSTNQTNFISQIPNATTPPVFIDSFKTTSVRDLTIPTNRKKQIMEKIPSPLSSKISDPRTTNAQQYAKLIAKSFNHAPHKIYIPTYKFDKHSLGDKPSNEIVIWNLHSTTPAVLIKNTLSQFGEIQDIKMIDDNLTAVPLGMCLISFEGKFDQAHATALKVVEECNKKLLIQGRYIRCGLNVKNKLYNEIYEKSITARNERLKKQKAEELKRKEEQEKAAAVKATAAKITAAALLKSSKPAANTPSTTPTGPLLKKPLSAHDKHILPLSAFSLTYKLHKFINNRSYIFIADKFLLSRHVTTDQLTRHLSKYNVSSILHQRSGFYVVFDNLDDAMRCFDEIDGKKLLTYIVFVTLYVPDEQLDETRIGKSGARKAAKAQIERDLTAYLFKDVRERIIGPLVLDTLQESAILEVARKTKEKKDLEIKEKRKEVVQNVTVKRMDLDVFRKIGVVKSRKSFVPVAHSLNKSHDSELEYGTDSEDSEVELESDVDTNAIKKRKADKVKSVVKKKVKDKEDEEQEEKENQVEFEEASIEIENAESIAVADDAYKPIAKPPGPVFEEIPFEPTLEYLKGSIFTDEDFLILKNICKDITLDAAVKPKDLQFWAWKHEEFLRNEVKLKEHKVDDGEEVEEFDFEDDVLKNLELKNKTGCFRTEGYHKIPDKLKREYLIHRRKLTNLNPVKQEEDDEANATMHNKIQSSRVNRANTRRFAADISAQKQIIGETDLLDLNQLNKRKKPVQFARSAIHNWGLYALEPINAGEMIIEYVGERIRQQVAELREKKYLRSGIGSSYLFRVDENTVIDASKKGGIARFINHCCAPSCTAKIIKVDGSKRIVIYALRDIKKNEELTYDYKFERETNDDERIVCLCGAPGCKGYLN